MILFKKGEAMQHHIRAINKKGLKIGWVPTMGALHYGHLSLIREAKKECQQVVCSIFVNPTQFNDKKDFVKYPVTIEKDIQLLAEQETDMLFLPNVSEIYPTGTDGLEHYDLGILENVFEGKFRPGHFQGVCQVMSRFIHLLDVQHLYMGQKDFQQCMVIDKLLSILHSSIKLHRCPTEREPDGLAMSSRNVRLSETERKNATGIFAALKYLQQNLKVGSLEPIFSEAKSILQQRDFIIDYVAAADEATLNPVDSWDGKQQLVALVAAYQHEVRLIDNALLTPSFN
jgi:pantoate--beta-alanine ligase